MTTLVHIRNGQIVKTYSEGKGWVVLEDGRRVSPPVAGFEDGADRIVPLVEETVDESTTGRTRSTSEMIVEADRVVRRKTVSDMPVEELRASAELPRFEFAMAVANAGVVTHAVAAQWAAGNTMPVQVQAVIDSLPAEQQGPATVDVLARPVIRRNGNMMPALAAAFSLSEAQLDALFGIG